MIVKLPFPATLDDLMKVEGKAELIGGRIVQYMATGRKPNRVAKRILRSLDDYERATGRGESFTDSMGYALPAPLTSGRESFSPDVSYYTGPGDPDTMSFIDGTPDFAVEVRSENDYGPAAERAMAAKRADYFEAGTAIVWYVDPVAKTVTRYSAESAETTFGLGDTANAEPALPGWRIAVDDVFA